MRILKVTGLTKNEVELRNHIYFQELGAECNYEDPYEGKDGFEWQFSYGADMKQGVMESWAKELGWDINFCKGVFGSLVKKRAIGFELKDVDSCVYCDTVNANKAEAFGTEYNPNGWFDYDLNGKAYEWELA